MVRGRTSIRECQHNGIMSISRKHQDYRVLNKLKRSLLSRVSHQALMTQIPLIGRDSIDFVLDNPFTGRTAFADLDSVERTFIGLKIEHRLRHILGLPKGKHDLVIGGMDVDCKNTIGNSWMIGPEIYMHNTPCILTQVDDESHCCSLGLIVARKRYLSPENRDKKRGILRSAFSNILWLIDGAEYPKCEAA